MTNNMKKSKEELVEELECLRGRVTKLEREGLERFGNILERSLNEICMFDMDTLRFVLVNRGARENLGYSMEELREMTPVDLQPEFTSESFEKLLAPLIEGDQDMVKFLTTHRRKDGSQYPVDIHLQLTDDNPRLFIAIIHDISKHRQIEERLDLAVYGADLGMWDWSVQTGDVTYSERWADILGYSIGEIEPRIEAWEKLLHPDDIPTTMKILQANLDGLTDFYESEHRLRAKSGEWRWLLARGKVVERDKNGLPLRHAGIHMDITGRKRVEESWLETADLNMKIIEESPIGISIYDEVGQCVSTNEAIGKIIGATSEQVLEQDYNQINSWKNGGLLDMAKNAIREGRPKRHDFQYMTSTFGKDINIDCYFVPFQRGGAPHLMFMMTDNTERVKAERALRESEERYGNLVDISPDPIAIFQDGICKFVNNAFIKIFGYSQEEIDAGMPFLGLVPEKDRERVEQQYKNWISESLPPSIFRVDVITKDGIIVSCESNGAHIEYEGRSAVMAIMRDVTEQKKNEEQLNAYKNHLEEIVTERTDQILKLEAEKSVMERMASQGRIAAGIAHEINNPMASIKNSFLLIKDLIPTDHQYHHYVGRIGAEIERITDIVKRMFQLYNPAAREKTFLNPGAILEDLMLMLESKIKMRGLTVELIMPKNIPEVLLSEGFLRQILINLLMNAIQASPQDGRIECSLHFETDSTLQFKITDFGDGIPEKDLPVIFEPFFTTKGGSTQEGMGLGLSISQSLAKTMGGRIIVESRQHQGTAFTLALPVQK